jgi:alkanesulfonate monooxygenase SsuD/methylene tetrahydromethanopterin reductase-like flavin-dependent oxidoreductase (luciferase family)
MSLCANLNIGLLFPFRNPPAWRRPWPQYYAEQLAQIRRAEELGFDEAWLTEHHFAEDGYSPALFPIAAAIAAITTRIRIGTNLVLLPLHNAVRVAEDAATIDVISNGRFDLGLGQGYSFSEFAGYGVDRKARASRLEEGIEVIRGAWTKENFSYSGRHYNVKNITIMPPAVQKPHPPLWVGAGAPKAIQRAGRMGCNFLSLGNPRSQEIYDDSLRQAGRKPADFSAAQLYWTYVAPTSDQAWSEAQDHYHTMLRLYGKWIVEANEMPNAEQFLNLPEPSKLRDAKGMLFAPIFGSPDEVAARLNESFKSVRTSHLIMGMNQPVSAWGRLRLRRVPSSADCVPAPSPADSSPLSGD